MILLYINAFFAVIYGAVFHPIGLLLVVAAVAAGFGIANERKWAYGLGVAAAIAPIAFRLFAMSFASVGLIGLLFDIALVALLLHPQSRDYQRIWFS